MVSIGGVLNHACFIKLLVSNCQPHRV